MKPKILILDDVTNYLDALERALSFDYEVITASSIEEAREKTNPEIDLFLVDICLDEKKPGEDRSGINYLEWIKKNYPGKPVIVMSAYRDYEAAVDALNKGAFKYLKKPIDLQDLNSTIQEGISYGKSRT